MTNLQPPSLAPLWLIGCGNMAGAMLSRWLEAGLAPEQVTVIRPSGRAPAPGIRTLASVPDQAPPRALLLGVKPQKLDEVAPTLGRTIGPETVLISILAGVDRAALKARFPNARAIVRAMPNTPVAIGRGVVALEGDVGPDIAEAVEALMQPLGLVEWIADARHFDLVTALAGSGPAFLFRFIDALAQGAADLGLPLAQAARLALATVDGAAGLASRAGESPAELAERVASPGGSTRKGLDVLDADDALEDLLRRTLAASEARNKEMAAAAR